MRFEHNGAALFGSRNAGSDVRKLAQNRRIGATAFSLLEIKAYVAVEAEIDRILREAITYPVGPEIHGSAAAQRRSVIRCRKRWIATTVPVRL